MKYSKKNLASKGQDKDKTAQNQIINKRKNNIMSKNNKVKSSVKKSRIKRVKLNAQKRLDKQMHLYWIIKKVEKGTGLSIQELRIIHSEKSLFYESLKYVSTTNRSLCMALDLTIANCCRYKGEFEKAGLLVQSVDKYVCRNSGDMAHLLTTNSNKFDDLLKSNQLKFDF